MSLQLLIDSPVYDKIMHWIDKADFEISGLGSVVVTKDGNLRVIDTILLKQEGNGHETELDPTAVAQAMTRHMQEKRQGELRFWWHSHVNMAAFWSGTDRDTIEMLAKHGWFVATVFNKKRELQSAFEQGEDKKAARPHLFLDHLETKVISPKATKEQQEQWDKEYEENVKRKTYTHTPARPTQATTAPTGSSGGSSSTGSSTTKRPLPASLWTEWVCPSCKVDNDEPSPFDVGEVVVCEGCRSLFNVSPKGETGFELEAETCSEDTAGWFEEARAVSEHLNQAGESRDED